MASITHPEALIIVHMSGDVSLGCCKPYHIFFWLWYGFIFLLKLIWGGRISSTPVTIVGKRNTI